jgi:hypothetical protein
MFRKYDKANGPPALLDGQAKRWRAVGVGVGTWIRYFFDVPLPVSLRHAQATGS